MKMYIFDPISYGEYYIVMSDSSENALVAIKKHIKDIMNNSDDKHKLFYKNYFSAWEDVTINNLPKDYRIIEKNINEIFQGEYS